MGCLKQVTKIKMKTKLIISGVMATALFGGTLAVSLASAKSSQIPLPPTPPPQSPDWLLSPTANLQYSLYQAMTLIDNADPSVGEMGITQQLILQRAIEYSATASQAIRDSEHQCFQKSLICPYDLIERGLKADWDKQSTADGKAAVIFKYRALIQARHGALISPKETAALFPRIIERLAQDRELAERLSLNGISQQSEQKDD